ncbi:MAG: T9SS type A sorting domain-containing protein [Saprospiraceae bacterium]
MKTVALSLLICLFIQISASTAQSFKVHDVIISDSTMSLSDPEVDWYGHHICWANAQGIWIADIDPSNGYISPKNGKGILLDSTPSFQGMRLVANGPEWVMSQEGTEIIYPDSATTASGFSIGRIKKIGNKWIQSPPPAALNKIPYFASFDIAYPHGAVTSAGINPNTMTGTGQVIRFINNAGSEVNLGQGSKGGRWIKGAEGIAFYKKIAGIDQVGYYLMSEGKSVQVSTNNFAKEQVWMFRSPEYNNELIVTCIEKKPNFDELAIYRAINNVWQKVDSLQSPSSRKGIFSPEPFWWNNKSYFFFVAERTTSQPANYYNEIWIMAIDPKNRFSRMVSNSFPANRTDPEVYYTGSEPVIYYTENRKGVTIMHKCATGLATTTSEINHFPENQPNTAFYPNPARSEIFAECKSGFQIFSSTGQLVKESKYAVNKIDIAELPAGIYFLNTDRVISRFTKVD